MTTNATMLSRDAATIAQTDDPIARDILRPIALELRHFRLVFAIRQLGGVTRASERLNLTQSALSHQLREIEDRLGKRLFHRIGRKLVPTEIGERLSDAATRVLGNVIDVEHDLFGEVHERSGTPRLRRSEMGGHGD